MDWRDAQTCRRQLCKLRRSARRPRRGAVVEFSVTKEELTNSLKGIFVDDDQRVDLESEHHYSCRIVDEPGVCRRKSMRIPRASPGALAWTRVQRRAKGRVRSYCQNASGC